MSHMFIYLASSPLSRAMCIGKIGCTEEPHGRRSTYLTGCPPGLTPSHDIDYDALWETTATTRDELFDLESEVHDNFLKYRMMREKPGDSEWFNFQGRIPYDAVKRFMESRTWVRRQIQLSEFSPRKNCSQNMRKQYHQNLKHIKVRSLRNTALNLIQEPVISSISSFMANADCRAGYVVAPCGSGKTVMTAKGICGVRKCVICCPSKQIQTQWKVTLVEEGVFPESQILILGCAGTTDHSTIRTFFEGSESCIISTYMSSHLLLDIIDTGLELLVLDEAHHMAGVVARDEMGEGRTRRLMLKASDMGIKRLSLTYTPRFIADGSGNDREYLTMDDDNVFGKRIAELKIRDLIRKGVLPDYRLWTVRDEARKGTGLIGKAECILEAWGATEVVRGEDKHVLHHLIVFASTTQDAKDLEMFLKTNTVDTNVLRVGEGDLLDGPIASFTSSKRAILVNCFVLNEGVDIPIANAVAITYPKQSRGQITQMVLRAGRWYEGKPLFHVLIPTLGDEDLSGFEEVLSALASCDEQLRDEIVFRTMPERKPSDPPLTPSSLENGDTLPECIVIDEFEADQEEVSRCFANVRKHIFPVARESRRIQELCTEKGVDTSVDYDRLCADIPGLPGDPRPKGVLWYDYLHPMRGDRITGSDFVKLILDPNNLRVGHAYDKWRSDQPTDAKAILPSVQHITDGFFGKDDTNFNTLREKFGDKVVVRGRRSLE